MLIKHYFLRKKTITETKERLDKYYGDSVPSISMVKKWFTEFRCGRTNTNDVERPGRPKDVVTPEIVDKIHGMILDDRRTKVREVAEAVGISTERVHHILHEYLFRVRTVVLITIYFIYINANIFSEPYFLML